MGIFGDFGKKEKPKETYEQIMAKYFKDKLLLEAIRKYMKSRGTNRLSKISFEEQLKVLATYPENERLKQVEKSILGGYMSMAYPKKVVQNQYMEVKKEKKENILGVGF